MNKKSSSTNDNKARYLELPQVGQDDIIFSTSLPPIRIKTEDMEYFDPISYITQIQKTNTKGTQRGAKNKIHIGCLGVCKQSPYN